MPHTPDTHLTITPKCVYINGEPINVTGHGIKLSDPTPTDIQTVTLTITPTTVTILNDDDPDMINAAREAVTRTTRDEANNKGQENYLVDCTHEALDNWKQYEAAREQHTKHTRT